jgi:Tol biopolymer transport system component
MMGSYEQLYYLNSDGQFFQTEQLRSINSNAFSLNTVGTDVTLTADGSAIGFISSSPLLDGYVETDRHAYIAYLNTGSINLIDTDKDGNPVQYDGSLPENERYPLQDNHNSAFHDGTGWLALDDYGNYAAFGTWRRESDLAGHLGGESRVDIFLKDLKTNEVVRVDNNTTNSGGISLLMSGDGSKIIFDTSEKQIEKDTNNARDIYIANNPFHVSPEIYGGDFLKLGYALKGNDNTGNPGGDAQVLGVDDTGLTNVAVLGPNTFDNKTYTLEISAESLKDGWDLESADIVLKYDTKLFETIDFDDIQIGGDLPISNAVDIDDVNGLIRIAAASLGSLGSGDSIDNEAIFAFHQG